MILTGRRWMSLAYEGPCHEKRQIEIGGGRRRFYVGYIDKRKASGVSMLAQKSGA